MPGTGRESVRTSSSQPEVGLDADEAVPAEACARVRWLMTRQLTRKRIAGGLGHAYAVAVFTRG